MTTTGSLPNKIGHMAQQGRRAGPGRSALAQLKINVPRLAVKENLRTLEFIIDHAMKFVLSKEIFMHVLATVQFCSTKGLQVSFLHCTIL